VRLAAFAAAAVLALGGAEPGERVVVRVQGGATTIPTTACFLLLRSRIVGGGTLTYCIRTFSGSPGANATVRDSGVMTLALPGGTIRTRVQIVQRFGADGAHARQTLTGTLLGGTGRYRNAAGTIRGGGSVLERPAGHIAASSLQYVVSMRKRRA
jgi:hypothetical protein